MQRTCIGNHKTITRLPASIYSMPSSIKQKAVFSRESDSTNPNVLQWCGYIKTWVRLYSKWCGYITHGAVIFKMVWLYSTKPPSALTLICHHQHPPHHFYTILITFLTTYLHPTTIVTNN